VDGSDSGNRQMVCARMTQSLRNAQQGHRTTGATLLVGRGDRLAVEAKTCELQRYEARAWRIRACPFLACEIADAPWIDESN